jgi:hypothetical protein
VTHISKCLKVLNIDVVSKSFTGPKRLVYVAPNVPLNSPISGLRTMISLGGREGVES